MNKIIYAFIGILALVLVFVFIIIVLAFLMPTRHISVKVSDILTFVSVLIALAALSITAYSNNKNFKAQNKQLSIAEFQLEQAKKEKKSEQAAKVACWIEKSSYTEKDGELYEPVIIQNTSSVPVYNVYLFSVSNRSSDNLKEINAIPEDTIYLDTLKPGETKVSMQTGGSAMGGERPSVAMTFKDTHSKLWFRSPHGNLKSISQKQLDNAFHTLGIEIPIPIYGE